MSRQHRGGTGEESGDGFADCEINTRQPLGHILSSSKSNGFILESPIPDLADRDGRSA